MEGAAYTNTGYDPSNQEAEAGDSKYTVSLDYVHNKTVSNHMGWGLSSVVEYLPSMCKAQDLAHIYLYLCIETGWLLVPSQDQKVGLWLSVTVRPL